MTSSTLEGTPAATTAALHDVPIISVSEKIQIDTTGRPPWYGQDGQVREAFVIGVAGGSASGKTSVTRKIIESLDIPWVVLLSMDSFYKDLGPAELEKAHRNDYNFDHPSAFDYEGIVKTLKTLKQGKKVSIPIYDFSAHRRLPKTETVYGADVIVFEGILSLCNKELLNLMDLRIFVDTDDDVRLARRLRRDIAERGRELNGIIAQYNKFVKPAFDEFIRPSMRYADLIIPRGVENVVAIDLITQAVRSRLEERGLMAQKSAIKCEAPPVKLPNSLAILRQDPCLSLLLRSPDTIRSQFITTCQPIIQEVISHAVHKLSYPESDICAVSIVRAGITLMEQALQTAAPSLQLGELLIETSPSTGEPELHLLRLLPDITKRKVILLDPMIATGAAATMAIRVLLDHEVPEENIYFLSLIVSPVGVHAIANAFPRVHMIAAELDNCLDTDYYTLRNRFFGID